MEGLPLLPGYSFSDPTQKRFTLPHTLYYVNGYQIPARKNVEGGSDLALRYKEALKPIRYDPSLTYGRVQSCPYSQFIPLFAKYRGKCLRFKSFFKQSVHESPDETYRVRVVNILYYLEDDTIAVMEPVVKVRAVVKVKVLAAFRLHSQNAGFMQGQLVRRGKIPKDVVGNCYHWKDLNIGYDVNFYCTVYHIVDADDFTKEFLESMGVEVNDPEEMPQDPYTMKRYYREPITTRKTATIDDKLRRLLEYDKKILRFWALWHDGCEQGEKRRFTIRYYLTDDTIEIVEEHQNNNGRDPFPVLLRRVKVPKNWKDVSVTHQPICWELTDDDVEEFYSPADFQIGETVFIFARRFFIYDADQFTRNFYRERLRIELKPPIDIQPEKKAVPPQQPIAPYTGFGSLEDSAQSCLRVQPVPPKRDFLRRHLNSGKKLRYSAKLDSWNPEDENRNFIISYLLENGEIEITELPKPKSEDRSTKKFLKAIHVPKPNQAPNAEDPELWSPVDFYVGAKINIFSRIFIITGADLAVYRYMQANPNKFPQAVIDNIRNYIVSCGFLRDEINDETKSIIKEQERGCLDVDQCCKEFEPGRDDTQPGKPIVSLAE